MSRQVRRAPVTTPSPLSSSENSPGSFGAASHLEGILTRGIGCIARPPGPYGIVAIDRAIEDIKEAALDDGKNLEDHPPVDAREPRGGRLHKALDALHTARGDIEKEEDNGFASGLRARASHDIDEAIHAVELGVQAAASAS